MSPNGSRPSLDTHGDVDAEPGKRDREVRFGSCEPQRQRHPEPELAVFQRVEQRHRLADGEDGHAES